MLEMLRKTELGGLMDKQKIMDEIRRQYKECVSLVTGAYHIDTYNEMRRDLFLFIDDNIGCKDEFTPDQRIYYRGLPAKIEKLEDRIEELVIMVTERNSKIVELMLEENG